MFLYNSLLLLKIPTSKVLTEKIAILVICSPLFSCKIVLKFCLSKNRVKLGKVTRAFTGFFTFPHDRNNLYQRKPTLSFNYKSEMNKKFIILLWILFFYEIFKSCSRLFFSKVFRKQKSLKEKKFLFCLILELIKEEKKNKFLRLYFSLSFFFHISVYFARFSLLSYSLKVNARGQNSIRTFKYLHYRFFTLNNMHPCFNFLFFSLSFITLMKRKLVVIEKKIKKKKTNLNIN